MGRYLQAFERRGIGIVRAKRRWAGPYRLTIPGNEITFDVSVAEAARQLGVRQSQSIPSRAVFLRFVLHYARAEWLFFQGRLVAKGDRARYQDSAYRRLLGLLEDRTCGPGLRLLALIAAVQVLFQLGRFEIARKTLAEYRYLLPRARDNALAARYYLALAWSHQRGSSGQISDRETLRALRRAALFAEITSDREVAGALAYRTSGYLTKHGRHADAVAELLRAVEAHLAIGNYQSVQACCVDIGSDLHRLGPGHYREAHHWILLGLAICRWMGIGRDNSHGETILGKMYVEQGQPRLARFWLDRALGIAAQANNPLILADAHMVSALWHDRFGTQAATVASLAEALRTFRSLTHFDCAQKEEYMARKFPEVWRLVAAKAGGPRVTNAGRRA